MNMYQPPIDSNVESTAKAKPNLADLFKSPEAQKNYAEQHKGEPVFVKMEDIYDMPISIMSYSIATEKSKFSGNQETFCRINFYFTDDESKTLRQCRTQSSSLMNALTAIGNEKLQEYDGVPTMILMKKDGAKTILSFDGIFA